MTTRKSRRDFIKKTAGAAAIVTALPSSSWASEYVGCDDPIQQGAPGTPAQAGEPIRIGVIGTGGMGTGHCEAFARFARGGESNVQIDALCDVCVPRMEAAKARIQKIRPEWNPETYTKAQ